MVIQGSSDVRASSPQEGRIPSPPPIPLQTYLWEDVKREKQRGGYPWTHVVKKPFDPDAPQEIIQYDRSPGSKRKYGSLDVPELDESPSVTRRRRAASAGETLGNDTRSNGEAKTRSKSVSIEEREITASTSKPSQAPASPRSILKNRPHDLDISATSTVNGTDKYRDSPKDTECCHPIVDKLKTIADKNILKSPRAMKKLMRPSPKGIKKHDGSVQEIIPLDDSPVAERRKRELEKVTFEKCSPSLPKRQDSKKYKDHIYESIEDLPKTLGQSASEKELNELSRSLHDTDQAGKEIADSDDFIARDSLTRSLDQYLKEELMGTEDKGIIDSKNQILQDILRRIADENEGGSDATAPLSKMDSEEDDNKKPLVKQMPVVKEDDVESTSSSKVLEGGDKCLVITDITETVEEEIVDFVVMPDEDQDIGELPKPDEIIDLEEQGSEEKDTVADKVKKTKESAKSKLEAAKSDAQGRWSTVSDHEYESIGDPDSETGQKAKDQHAEDEPKAVHSDVSSTTSAERKQLQAASSIDEQSPTEENVDSDREMTVQEMQQQIEDKFFKPPEEKSTLPSIQVETPEIAHSGKEQDEAQAASPRTVGQRGREMQRRFKAQAGVLKTKFKGMKKPSFTLPERKKPKLSDETESSTKSRLSGMPKISMPEFKMPDRPKISMPEFKMPERAKMSMPQFKMPDRSKFKMPERPHMPDFKMPDRPKMPDFKMPEFKMPNLKRNNSLKEHASSESTADSKKRIALDFRTYPRIFSKKSRDEEYVTSSPKDERTPVESATVPRAAARKKGPVGARWVNRFSDIKFVDDGLTDARRGDFEDRLHRLDEDYKQMQQEQEYDEDVQPDVSIERSVKTGESFDRGGDSLASEEYSGQPNNRYWADEEDIDHQNRDFNYGVPVSGEQTPASTQEERGSSGESYERHRMGVLDELDADDYYLRQKGISEDDIQVEKYLSSEIRDAFKTPVNALEQLGSYNGYDDRDLDLNDYSASRDIGIDDDMDMDVSLTPLKPERTRSLRKQRLLDDVDQQDFDGRSDDFARSNEGINGYNTFPPNRPRRQKKTKKTKETKDDIPPYNVDDEYNDENDRNLLNRDDVDNFDRLLYENEVMEGKTQPDILVIKPKLLSEDRRFYENEEEFASNRDINAYENEENYKNILADQIPPRAPRRKRKRSARDLSASSEPGSMINAQFHDDWPSLTQLPPDMDDDIIVHRVEHEYVIPLAESEHFPSPTPPRRTRSRSLASRTTAGDDDRTSHGAESLISDNQQPPLAKDSARNILDIHDGSGYAVVKRTPSVPKRRKRASKSAEDRPGFSTTPRMKEPPPRPPPRGISAPDLSKASPDVTQYEEVDDDERIEDLHVGDVINKMKDRPLPAPPRPPRAAKRKKKKGLDKKDDLDYKKYDDVDEEVRLKFLDDEDRRLSLEERNILDRLRQTDYGSTENIDLEEELLERALIRDIAGRMVDDVILNAESHVEQRNADETEMWTQTDPLPDDFVCEEVETGPDTKFIEPTILKDDWKEPKVFTEDISMSTLERNKDDSKHDKLRHDSSKEDSRLDPLDIERARKIADDESLSRGLRRFRESSRQRTFSSSRTPSERAPSEKALLLERTVVTPTKTEDVDEVLTKATLFVKPVDDELDIEDFLEEEALEKKRKYLEETSLLTDEPAIKDIEHESEILPEEEPPIPVKRRTSLKKSRPIPVPPLSTEVSQELESPVIENRILERRVEVPAPPTQDNQVEVLKTNRLQVSNLDVENLNVSQLQANSIKVSEVDGVALQVKELNSKSGNLVVSGIDIAPGVLQEILDKLAPALPHPSSQMSTQTEEPYAEPKQREAPETAPEIAPERPPPPPISPESMYGQHPYLQQGMYYPYPGSIPPASFYALRPRDYSEEETQQIQATLPRSPRRSRHVQRRGSTSEEEHQNQESVPRHRRPGTKSPEPSVREISGQLVRACCNSVQRNVKQAWNVIKTRSNTEEHRREIQIALLILLVFTAGLILIGLSDNKTVHHHHWEFFNPPSDKNA